MHRTTARGFRITLDGHWCIYCGEMATCLDHFPPYACTHQGFLLPACHECNSLAGIVWPYNFKERCIYVKQRLEMRHARALRVPYWFPKELERLRPGRFKTSIAIWLERKKNVQSRLAWNVEAYLAFIDHNNVFAAMLAEVAGTPENEAICFEKHMRLLRSIE